MRQEFYRDGKLVWTSTDRSAFPPEQLCSTVEEVKAAVAGTQRPRDRVGVVVPMFSGMGPLTLRDGVAFHASYQEVDRDDNRSRAHNFLLAVSHELGFVGQPSLAAYGALGVTSIEFGSLQEDELCGKRTLEVGGRWRSKRQTESVSAGVAVPVCSYAGDSVIPWLSLA